MIGLDTNVILRFLVQDHPIQAKHAKTLFASFVREGPGFITTVVIAEVAWVLRTTYKLKRLVIADFIEGLAISSDIEIERHDIVLESLQNYRHGKADLADYLIAALNHAHGCDNTVTFDRVAAKATGMKLL